MVRKVLKKWKLFQGPVLIASKEGGVNIEEIAEKNPDAILTIPIDIHEGLSKAKALDITAQLEIREEDREDVSETLLKLYKLFLSRDASMVEINPFAEDSNGGYFCLDAKLRFDDNAEFRYLIVVLELQTPEHNYFRNM